MTTNAKKVRAYCRKAIARTAGRIGDTPIARVHAKPASLQANAFFATVRTRFLGIEIIIRSVEALFTIGVVGVCRALFVASAAIHLWLGSGFARERTVREIRVALAARRGTDVLA